MRPTKSFRFASVIIRGGTDHVKITDSCSKVAKKWHWVISINPRHSYDFDLGTAYALGKDHDYGDKKDSSD